MSVLRERVGKIAERLERARLSASSSATLERQMLNAARDLRAILDLDSDTPDSEPSADAPAWQPIEAAPKDGTFVLAGWFGDDWSDYEPHVLAWDDGWYDDYDEGPFMEPTHWMPLPAAPVPATERETSGVVEP